MTIREGHIFYHPERVRDLDWHKAIRIFEHAIQIRHVYGLGTSFRVGIIKLRNHKMKEVRQITVSEESLYEYLETKDLLKLETSCRRHPS